MSRARPKRSWRVGIVTQLDKIGQQATELSSISFPWLLPTRLKIRLKEWLSFHSFPVRLSAFVRSFRFGLAVGPVGLVHLNSATVGALVQLLFDRGRRHFASVDAEDRQYPRRCPPPTLAPSRGALDQFIQRTAIATRQVYVKEPGKRWCEVEDRSLPLQ